MSCTAVTVTSGTLPVNNACISLKGGTWRVSPMCFGVPGMRAGLLVKHVVTCALLRLLGGGGYTGQRPTSVLTVFLSVSDSHLSPLVSFVGILQRCCHA